VKDRTLNCVGRNVGRSDAYHEGIEIWKAAYNGNPAYIHKKHFNNIRFIYPILTVDVKAKRRLRDAIKTIEKVVKDSIV